MCKIMDEYTEETRKAAFAKGKAEGREEGRAEGKAEGIMQMVRKLLAKGNCPEEIADTFDIPLEEVLKALEKE